MSKYRFASAAAIAAGLALTFASAEFSGAVAQEGDTQDAPQAVATPEVMPVFVSEEVVQPLPEKTEAATDTSVETEISDDDRPASLRELVAETRAPDQLSAEMECLAGAVYFESRGEPLNGQLAVAQVVINRTESRQFPSSYCGVVYQRAQFSFVRGGSMPRIKRGSTAWARAKKVARIAHEGLWDSEAQDSLYFHAKYVRPGWSRKKTARATINTHIFYR